MDKPQYTPGSWRADITPHGVSIRAGALGTRDAANSIAWLGDSNLRPSAENEANAHLMAAAPALLEALEAIDATLKPGSVVKDFLNGEDVVFGYMDTIHLLAVEALAAARGEEVGS